jgi:subtilase family serine protease
MKSLSIEDTMNIAGGSPISTAGKWLLNQLASTGVGVATVEGVKYVMDCEGAWYCMGGSGSGSGGSITYTDTGYSCAP